MEEGRKCYKLDQHEWICSNNHVVEGVEDGKKAVPCSVCKETFEDRVTVSQLGLNAVNGMAKLFCKSGQPASIPFDQFLKALFGSHGQPGSGIRQQAGDSARYSCTNQCSRLSVDLKDAFPQIPEKKSTRYPGLQLF